MDKNISDFRKRPLKYWFSDGIGELVLGLVMVLVGVVSFISHLSPDGSPASSALGGSFQMLAIVLLIVGGRYLIGYLKARTTYPRTGFVSYERKVTSKARWLGMFLGLAFGIFFGVVTNFLIKAYGTHWLLFYTGTVLGLVFAIAAFKSQVNRMYVMAIIAFSAGAFAAWAPVQESVKYFILFGIIGAALMLSGWLTLQHYLRNTQPAPGKGR